MRLIRPPILGLALFAAAYVLAGRFGYGLALIPGVAITFWPPAGIFLAALLLSRPRSWGWWIATACAAELTCNQLWFHNPVPFAVIYFIANALESMTGAALINRFAPRPFRLDSVEQAGWFVVLCAGVAPIVGATIIATTDALLGKHAFGVAFPLIWLGDGSGLLVSAPITIFAVRAWRERERIPPWRFPEAALVLLALVAAGVAGLKGYLPSIYVILPLMLWAAARFGLKGAAVALAVVTIVLAGFGADRIDDTPGGEGLLQDQVVRLQTFLGVSAVCSLFVGAMSSQRRRAMEALRTINRDLERRVEERTADLRQSEQRLRLAARSARFGVHDHHLAADACFWTDELYDICGVARGSVVAPSLFESLIHPEDGPRIIPKMRAALDPDGSGEFHDEFRIVRVDSAETRWIEHRCSTEFATNPDGTRAAIHSRGIVLDINDRKVAELALQRSEERLRLVLETDAVVVMFFDYEGTLTAANDVFVRMTGYTREQIERRELSWRSMTPPEWREVSRRQMDQLQRTGRIGPYEKEYLLADGSRRWMLAAGRDLGDGTIAKFCVDIADRKQAEQSLRANRDAFYRLVKGSPFGVYLVDADFKLAEVSAGAAAVFAGVEPLLGRDYAEILRIIWPEPFVTQAIEIFRRTLETGEPYVSPNFMERRVDRGTDEAYDWRIERVMMPDGRFGVVCHFYDLTAQRRLEDDLRRARDEAQAANAALSESDRKKDEFLATLAHELRNPLAPVMNSVALLNRVENPHALVIEARDTIHRQVTHLVRLVDDLLDLSRITQGRIQLRKQRIDLRDCVRQALQLVEPACAENMQELRVDLPDDPLLIEGDDARITQVVGNLLTNACRYTPPGGKIHVSARETKYQVIVSVRDTGIGIPPDKLEDVFEMFGQLERPLERAAGGLGIGLNLVRKLVQMHGGTVQASSEGEGRGSEFTVELPAWLAPGREEPPPAPADVGFVEDSPSPGACRILIADDNVDSAESLAMLLKLSGHQTRTAHDGAEALELAREIEPDVVLLDIGMPRLNGYEACREIRRALTGREPLMIAVSGWGQDNDRRASAEAGFDQHLVKPVDFASLETLLSSHKPRHARVKPHDGERLAR